MIIFITSKSCFEIISKTIFEDIIKLGGTPRKSKYISFPNVPEEYLPDFLRGLFDGDGCVYEDKRTNNCFAYICSGSTSFLNELKNVLEKLNIEGRIHSNGNKDGECFKVCMGVVQTKKFFDFIYKDIDGQLKLERKFNKFKEAEERRHARI